MRNSLLYPILGLIIWVSLSISIADYLLNTSSINNLIAMEELKISDVSVIVAEHRLDDKVSRIEAFAHFVVQDMCVHNSILEYGETGLVSQESETELEKLISGMEVNVFALVDGDGRLIYGSRGYSALSDMTGAPGMNEALSGRAMITTFEDESGWAVRAIAPIESGGDVIGAVMIGRVIGDEFTQSVASELGVEVSIGTVDGIFASSLPVGQRTIIDQETLAESMSEKKKISVSHPEMNRIITYRMVRIVDQTFVLIIGVDTSESQQLLMNSQLNLIFLSVMLSALSILIGFIVSRSIIRPLRILQKASDRMAAGKLKTRIGIKANNEVGSLASALTQMAKNIVESRNEIIGKTKELEKSKKELEYKIEELERFNKLTVGRELKMIELKKKIRELEGRLWGGKR